MKLSIRKYFNRMCYRPTPFGLFSAFSPLLWGTSNARDIKICAKGELFLNPDFSQTATRIGQLQMNLFETTFYPNNTMYQTGASWRYLVRKPDEVFGKEHGIQRVGYDGFLKNVLKFCTEGRKGHEVIDNLFSYFEDEVAAQGYLIQLINAQLLISELMPNIIGEPYTVRMLKKDDTVFSGTFPENLRSSNEVHVENECLTPLFDRLYGVYKRKVTDGSLELKYQKLLLEGLSCLHKLTRLEQPALLTAFKKKFSSKFENEEIPLLTALDPELGVGYGNMEQLVSDDGLCSDIVAAEEGQVPNLVWGEAQKLLVSKWTGNLHRQPTESIVISEEDMASLSEDSSVFPSGFNIVFRILESNKILIEQAGGITATALHGRFTPFDDMVLSKARQIAHIEQHQNQQVVFAEIGYFNNEHAANINTRDHLFDYEIPILTHSTLPWENQIPLNDLVVSVVNHKIILRSKRLNKVIVPRLSSAYNYNRSELSAFRFLCDLQYQGVKSNFGLDMKRVFPDLPFYPRVEYKSCILSPATWVLGKAEIKKVVLDPESFLKVAKEIKLPRFISLTKNDNQLVFDLEAGEEVDFLIQCISKNSQVELTEFLEPSSTVKDNTGNTYMNQFIASVYNPHEVYSMELGNGGERNKTRKIKRSFVPGEEWVYLKVYCHEAASDEILLKYVDPVVASLKREAIIDQWFFVRYRDPEPHIRIRMKKTGRTNTNDIFQRLSKKLYPLLRSGSISSIQADTYKRELERYGSEIMEQVEALFAASSDIVIGSLRKNAAYPDPQGRLIGALQAADLILRSLARTEHRASVLTTIYKSMSREFEGGTDLKVKLDMKFREHRSLIEKGLAQSSLNKVGSIELNTALTRIKAKSCGWPLDRQFRLIGDLLHMHMNRVFTFEQRKHEFIAYYLLEKYYKSLIRKPIYGLSGSDLRQYA